jgi:O-antigen/teichoic acid export membrane protein
MVLTGLPFLLINGTHFAIQRLDVLMLSWITTDERVGIYSAASRLIFASLFLASSIGAMLYPVLSRVVAEDGARAKELYRDGTVYVYVLGCLTALLFWQLAPWLVNVLYGTGFEESAPVLQVLGLFLPLFSLGLVASNVLMVSRAVWHAVWASILALLAGVLLSPWTIAQWGIQGAAVGVLVAEVVAAVLYALFAFTRLGMVFPARRVLSASISCLLPPALLSLTGSATGLWQGAVGAVTALALMLLLRTMTFEELRSLLRLVLPPRTGA